MQVLTSSVQFIKRRKIQDITQRGSFLNKNGDATKYAQNFNDDEELSLKSRDLKNENGALRSLV